MSPPDPQNPNRLEPPLRARYPRDGEIITVVGAPEVGKTTLIGRSLARDVIHHGRRAVVLDKTGDTGRYLVERFGVPQEWTRTAHTHDQVERELRPGVHNLWRGARVVCITRHAHVAWKAQCEAWLKAMNVSTREGWVYACDEAELVLPNRGQLRDAELDAIKLARNRRHRLYLATQRPQYLATIARSNTKHVCVMHSDSDAVVDPGCREFGNPELFARATALPKLHYLYRPRFRPDETAPLEMRHALEDDLPWL